MNQPLKRRRRFQRLLLAFVLALGVCVAGAGTWWEYAPPEQTCLSCHELGPSLESWSHSSHRHVDCKACHGGTFTNGLHGMAQHTRRLFRHVSAIPWPEEMRLSEEQVVAMGDRCRECHASEYAGWLASGHSLTYADMLLHEGHNQMEPPHADCLRCHGMFFEGSLHDLIERDDTTSASWRLLSDEQGQRPAIPCLACHLIHTEGTPASRPDYARPHQIATERGENPSEPAFYVRADKMSFAASDLPQGRIWHKGRAIGVSPDPLQRLCVQCHAPEAFHRSGTSDDRTPRGVHEGLSCLVCHQGHSGDTRRSCEQCHPQRSNCGLNVEAMDTTFQDPDSSHNIHFMECADCHPDGAQAI